MISRRNLRIKVLQSLYALDFTPENGSGSALEFLEKSVDGHYRLIQFLFYLTGRVGNYALTDAGLQASKKSTQGARKVNLKISNNVIVTHISSREKDFKVYLPETVSEKELIVQSYRELLASKEYAQYLASGESLESDKEIVISFVKEVLLPGDVFNQAMEDISATWLDDRENIETEFTKAVKAFDPASGTAMWEPPLQKVNEEKEFVTGLLKAVLETREESRTLITSKLENWDITRISMLDSLIMQLALCEMLRFEEIPLKVTLNEYIEISKTYSTPRSKEFINGVLDKLMKDLSERGAIRKTGRGLAN